MGLFNDTAPPWPEAQEAETVGRALALVDRSPGERGRVPVVHRRMFMAQCQCR